MLESGRNEKDIENENPIIEKYKQIREDMHGQYLC